MRRPERSEFFKGLRLTSDGPRVPFVSKRDLVKQGAVPTSGAGGEVLLGAKIRDSSLTGIKERLDQL